MAPWLKRSVAAAEKADADAKVRATVEALLTDIEARGDAALREMSIRFDGWDRGDFRLTDAEIRACPSELPQRARDDIRSAQEQVRNLAEHQPRALTDIEVATLPGVVLSHRNIPVNSVGCYVPGGKYPLLASAHMWLIAAKVARVPRVVTCAPPDQGRPAPAVVAAQHLAGADVIYCIGGGQAVGAMELGTERISPMEMLVPPGDAYVGEAKRLLFGRVGLDLTAGPTETLIIADETADAGICATALLGQAEHGPTSRAILLADSERLAQATIRKVERLVAMRPLGRQVPQDRDLSARAHRRSRRHGRRLSLAALHARRFRRACGTGKCPYPPLGQAERSLHRSGQMSLPWRS